MVYGFALHRELEALVDAGLTPYDALVAATRNPAEFLGAQDEFGTIVPGRRADLVLLGGDPRADITNTRRIEGVMVGGRWLDRERLDGMLEAGRRAIAGGG
jgi:imidazolonepropionase-like amidohydrolase